MTQDIAQRLLNMKQAIEKAKADQARIEGQIAQVERQRAEQLGCSSDEELEEYIAQLEQEIPQLERELAEGVAAAEEELGWKQ